MTETWVTENDSSILGDLVPTGYGYFHHPRSGRRGGGTGLAFRETIDVRKGAAGEKDSFEFAEYLVSFKSFRLYLIIIYRPPYSEQHPVTVTSFVSEFNDYIQCHLLSNNPLFVTGDFNIHVDTSSPDSRSFSELIESLSCQQLVNFSTHKHGHTLDLMICRQSDDVVIGQPWPQGSMISDHIPVMCHLNSHKPPLPSKVISFRRLSAIDIDILKSDIAGSELCKNVPKDLTELASLYDVTLTDVLNKHAPVITKKVVIRPYVPWYTDRVKAEKRKRRKAERRWLKTRSDRDWDNFKSLRNSTLHVLSDARRKHHRDMVVENKDDQKGLFKVVKSLLNMSNQNPVIPCTTDKDTFVNALGKYFHDKVVKIHKDIETSVDVHAINESNIITPVESSHNVVMLSSFRPLSENDTEKLIMKLSKKSCELDPIPTKVLLQCTSELISVFTSFINMSLTNGQFPSQWKVALVKPLLKKPGLELEYSNLRPVSNLKYMSKLVEGAATEQILDHLKCNSLLPPNQSAYRQFYSTETALLRIRSDLLMAMDDQKVTALLSLDLSSAFDTIDHSCLLDTLKNSFHIHGTVLKWIESYLNNRFQKIKIDDAVSDVFPVTSGVPQGSRLGPILFTLYTTNLITNVQKKFPSVSCHCYADDTQLYISFKPDAVAKDQSISNLEACVKYVRGWMLQNKLKLNDGKTELLIVGTPKQVSKLDIDGVTVGDSVIKPSESSKNLGVLFDTHLNMEKHITSVCKSAYFMIYNLKRIRKYLDQDSAKTIVHACVTSKLDYCNSLLFGLPESQIGRLQRVQNTCARLICNTSKFSRITPVLRDLHWLPVRQRILFKMLLIVYKALNGLAPSYITELLKVKSHMHSHNLRSSQDTLLLQIPSHKTKITLGDRAFACAGPRAWNNLPLAVRKSSSLTIFKSRLKSHFPAYNIGRSYICICRP